MQMLDDAAGDAPNANADETGSSAILTGLPCLASKNFETSYTWHSAQTYEPESADEEWWLGIDEAGRGPVLGENSLYVLLYTV